MRNIFYFGCVREPGHFLWDEHFHRYYDHAHPDLPIGFPVQIHVLDGGLFPKSKFCHSPGVAFLAHINGWSTLSFVDNSVDSRPGSHSIFIIGALYDFRRIIMVTKKVFPAIWERFKFEVVPHETVRQVEHDCALLLAYRKRFRLSSADPAELDAEIERLEAEGRT